MKPQEELSETYKAAGYYLCHLIRCALNDEKASEKPENIPWKQVYMLAVQNSVEGISYFGVETLDNPPPEEICNAWKNKRNMTIYRQLAFDEEREYILAEMRAANLSYLPLKGIHITGYYPKPGMRFMADNDILYGFVEEDPAGGYRICGNSEKQQEESVHMAQKVMTRIMEERGYETESLLGNHDCFLKKPIYNFEMHRKLAHEFSPHYQYYKNPWKKAIRDSEESHSFVFSDEDEYIYFLAHAYKHFDSSGCGIRSVVDQYVFLKEKGDKINLEYIYDELRSLELMDFHEKIDHLGQAAFGGSGNMNCEDESLMYYMLGCGTYGNVCQNVRNKMKKLAAENGKSIKKIKRKYIFERLFPSEEWCKNYMPFFCGRRYLLPLAVPYRLFRGLFRHPEKLRNEFNTWRKTR